MNSAHIISENVKGIKLKFRTESTLFSPKSIDKGTLAMLSVIDFTPKDKLLDLGCGYGVVGILAAKIIGQDKVTMCDVSPVAVEYAKMNAVMNGVPEIAIHLSDGFENFLEENFTLILSNPPYHTDFSVPKHFIEGGFRKLVVGGRLIMVTKRLTWYQNKMTAVFGGVKVYQKEGYYILVAEKRKDIVKKKVKASCKLSKKLSRKVK